MKDINIEKIIKSTIAVLGDIISASDPIPFDDNPSDKTAKEIAMCFQAKLCALLDAMEATEYIYKGELITRILCNGKITDGGDD